MQPAEAAPVTQLRHLDLAAVLAVIGAFALSMGYAYPAIALNMQARGLSETAIGVLAAVQGLGVLASALLLPTMTHRFGAWRLVTVSLVATAATIALLGVTDRLEAWFVLRFLLGCGANVLFVTCEVWINVLAPDAMRGRIIGIYTTVISAMFAAGPLLVPLIGYEGLQGFGTVAVLFLLLGLPVLRLRTASTPTEKAPLSEYPRVLVAIPVLLMAVATFSFFDGAVLALWVVYGVGDGLSASGAALSLAVLVAGNIVLQYPIGWLADRMSRRLLLGLLSGLAFAGGLLLPQLSLASPLTYVFLFFWGAIGFGVYTIAVTLIGQYLTGSRLVAANSAFGIMWGIGAMLGPVAAGAAMERIGGAGLPLSIAVAYGLLTLLAVVMPPIRESLRRLERHPD